MLEEDLKMENKKTLPELQYGKKVDKCFVDLCMKAATGFATGSLIALFFFKRKSWVIAAFTGIGIGMATKACEQELNFDYNPNFEKNLKDVSAEQEN